MPAASSMPGGANGEDRPLPRGALPAWAAKPAGFSFVELIVIIVIIGVLAAVAVPRFFVLEAFQASGTAGDTVGILRYAQLTAVAQRRTIYVNINGATGTISLCYVNSFPCASAADQVPGPSNEKPYSVTAAGSTISPNATFFFDALGRPYNSGDTIPNSTFTTLTVTVTGGGSTSTITVEQETGYVSS